MGVVDSATRSVAKLINSPFEFLYRFIQQILSYIVRRRETYTSQSD